MITFTKGVFSLESAGIGDFGECSQALIRSEYMYLGLRSL